MPKNVGRVRERHDHRRAWINRIVAQNGSSHSFDQLAVREKINLGIDPAGEDGQDLVLLHPQTPRRASPRAMSWRRSPRLEMLVPRFSSRLRRRAPCIRMRHSSAAGSRVAVESFTVTSIFGSWRLIRSWKMSSAIRVAASPCCSAVPGSGVPAESCSASSRSSSLERQGNLHQFASSRTSHTARIIVSR